MSDPIATAEAAPETGSDSNNSSEEFHNVIGNSCEKINTEILFMFHKHWKLFFIDSFTKNIIFSTS